jgi:ATP-dependent DNA helicase RecG
VIGTHALLHQEEALEGAGIVVIDEQHKFGVLQRSKLSLGKSAPDVLVMTATPIPRTLAQTLYGDLDLTILDEQPPGRGKLRTAARTIAKLPEITAFLRGELEKGRQAFIVYPLIEESEKLTAKAAEKEISLWKDRLIPHSCALLHGRLSAEEKGAVMRSFLNGSIQVLVTTSVIEVGVDIPNASFLLVENAERFGLAQLHQLRGRIGRGIHTSTCVLLEGSGSEDSFQRLKILEKSNDGFVIAEEDLRLRGSGDILGTAQSGLPPLRIADLYRDADLIPKAANEAQRILKEDPELKQERHLRLRKLRTSYELLLPSTTG